MCVSVDGCCFFGVINCCVELPQVFLGRAKVWQMFSICLFKLLQTCPFCRLVVDCYVELCQLLFCCAEMLHMLCQIICQVVGSVVGF